MISGNNKVATIGHARKFALQYRKLARTQRAFVDDRHDFRPDSLQGKGTSIARNRLLSIRVVIGIDFLGTAMRDLCGPLRLRCQAINTTSASTK
jgi:hypothetical protein